MLIPNQTASGRLALTFALAAMITAGVAHSACAGSTDAVKTETLPNGMKVQALENHKAPVATFILSRKAGSRNETFGQPGIPHLLEHTKLRRTNKYGPVEFANHTQENRGKD